MTAEPRSLCDRAPLGECFWHPGVPFDQGIALCDDDGIVRSGPAADYPCTGGAHRYGRHIRCTSPAHPTLTTTADALPERPERIEEPLPEDFERVLRDPEFAIPQDLDVHRVIRKHLQENPEATVTRHAYLNLWALIETGAFGG